MRLALEVIAASLDDALAGEAGGADRIELVRDLSSGGLSPALSVIESVVARVRVPMRVMVRESISHVVDDGMVRRRLIAAATALEPLPLDGIVCGFVRDGRVDRDLLSDVLRASGGKRATFHRAFESIADPIKGISDLAQSTSVDRILTNGGEGEWPDRLGRLTEWTAVASPRIRLIVGGGLTRDLLPDLVRIPNLHEIHVGRAAREPETDDGLVVAHKVSDLIDRLHTLSH
jgi:copper homeostasis protein